MSENNPISRRNFLGKTAVAAAAVAVGRTAIAPAMAADMVDPTEAQAASLGYVADASTVDTAKYARYKSGQACSNCQLYSGADGADMGPCGIFGGRNVKAAGWCNVYAPKA